MVNASGVLGVVVAAMTLVGGAVLASVHHALAQVGLVVVLTALGWGVTRRLAMAAAHPYPRVAGTLGAATMVPVVALASWRQLEAPLGGRGAMDGLDLCVALLAVAAVATGTWTIAARVRRPRGLLSLAVALALAASATGVGAYLSRPSATAYLGSSSPLDAWRSGPFGFEERRDRHAAVAVGGACVGAGCAAHLRVGDRIASLPARFPRGVDLSVARAPGSDTLVVRADGAAVALFDDTMHRQEASVAALGARVSPPLGHVLLAMLALAGTLVLSLRRRRLARRGRAIENAREAWVDDRGRIDDQRGIPHDTDLPPGPALVLTEAALSLPYRGRPLAPARVEAGDRAAARAQLHEQLLITEALALSWCITLCTPILCSTLRSLAAAGS